MLLYFYLFNAVFLRTRMRPALAESWRRRSFLPCRDLCVEVLAHTPKPPPEDSVLRQTARHLPFAREFWHALVGELLLFGCEDMPFFQTAPATFCCLLAPEQYRGGDLPRAAFAPIQQIHFGSRDLQFGGAFHRPDHVGFSDEDDVVRLARYMDAIDPATWHEAMLRPMPEFTTVLEREEELAFARDWWPALTELYRSAMARECVVVCEQI